MRSRSSKIWLELNELVRIIASAGPLKRRAVSLEDLRGSEQSHAKLYRTLAEDPGASEETAYRQFSKADQNGRKEWMKFAGLKSRLKSSLIDTLFLLDLDAAGHSTYSVSLYTVNRLTFLARVLHSLGARQLAISISRKGVSTALSIEEWSCAMEFLFILRREASRSGDSKAHCFYMNEYLTCQQLRAAEQEAELQMEQLQLAFARKGGENIRYAGDADAAASRVDSIALINPSFKLSFLALRLHAAASQMRMDHERTLEICNDALNLLSRYPQFSNNARRAEYGINMLVSACQLNRTAKCEEAIRICKDNLIPTTNNWFVFKEYEYLFLMRSLRFKEALELVSSVISHERFDTQPDAFKEKWELFRLYADFTIGSILTAKTPPDFNLLVPTLTPDKTGFNTAMIVLHILLLAHQGKFGDVRDRIEFVKGYKRRHLRGAENSHAAHFFRMLSLIETCDLNYKKISRTASKSRIELARIEKERPFQGEQVLPYSWCWEYLMAKLREYHHVAHTVA
jgi:hypothetical protein